MKNIILIIFSIMLGVYIFALLIGDSPSSMKSHSKTVMQQQIEQYKVSP